MSNLYKSILVVLVILIISLVGITLYKLKYTHQPLSITENNTNTSIDYNEEFSNSIINNSFQNEYTIRGTFDFLQDRPTTRFSYIFVDDKNVIFASDGVNNGTYTIENNIIKIKYYESLSPADNIPMNFVKASEELTIVDESRLINNTSNEEYTKVNEKTYLDFNN